MEVGLASLARSLSGLPLPIANVIEGMLLFGVGGAAVNAARGAPVVRATGGALPASGGAATGMQYDEYNARPVR
jgi:hypothetical protein